MGDDFSTPEPLAVLFDKVWDLNRVKDEDEADRVRDQLQEAAVALEDGPQGTTWRRA